MGEQKPDLVGILNSEDPHETPRRDIMHVRLIPFLPDLPIGVTLFGMYGPNEVKFIPRSVIPEKFRDKIDLGSMYVVAGNLMTRYARNLCFTEFEVAPPPDPKDGLG